MYYRISKSSQTGSNNIYTYLHYWQLLSSSKSMQHPQISATAESTTGLAFWTCMYDGQLDAIIAAVSFSKTRRKNKGPNQASSKGERPQAGFW